MICFKTTGELDEWRGVHPILKEVVKDWAEIWGLITGAPLVVITEIYRSHQESVEIYAAAGLVAPAVSVHETRPEQWVELSGIRGVDASTRAPRSGQYSGWPHSPDGHVEQAVQELNQRWIYQAGGAHQVALYHSVGGKHVHLQCRPGSETHRR